MRTPHLAIVLLSSVGVLVGVGILSQNSSFANGQPASAHDFRQAQQQWNAERPSHYRVTMTTYGSSIAPPGCQQTVEVQNEQVVRVLDSTCPADALRIPMTVSQVFEQFQDQATQVTCGPNGCACDGVVQVRATYDPQLGYPQQIESKLTTDWLNSEYWRTRWTGQPCTMIGFIEHQVAIESLEPIAP